MDTRSVADDVAAVGRINAVPSILQLICNTTGLRFAAVARVTQTTWTACSVRDEIDLGLQAGGELPLKTTICDEIRSCGRAIIIDHDNPDGGDRLYLGVRSRWSFDQEIDRLGEMLVSDEDLLGPVRKRLTIGNL